MSLDPSDLLESVEDQETFLEFVRALIRDRIEGEASLKSGGGAGWTLPDGTRFVDSDENGWRNFSIEDFLGASLGWAEDTEFGKTQNISTNPWRQFATFLYLGKIYE
jgi:hypothetical protein